MLHNKHNLSTLLIMFQKNNYLIDAYILELFKEYIPIYENINIDKPLISLLSFYPLPFELQIDYFDNEIIKHKTKNKYRLLGSPGDRILFANRRIPMFGMDPIPFSFPITENNITNVIHSNTYYFEVTIGKKFRKPWLNECLAIGYGCPSVDYNSQLGWCSKTWGFHSDDGIYIHNNKGITFTEPWKDEETYGVGLKYLSRSNYGLFLTKNGSIVNNEILIQTTEYLIPMISLDISSDIEVNFGQNNFLFNLREYTNDNKILSCKNIFFNNYSIENYNIKPNKSKKISTTIIPMFGFMDIPNNFGQNNIFHM